MRYLEVGDDKLCFSENEHIWLFPKNMGKTPKWIPFIKNGKTPIFSWDDLGGSHYFPPYFRGVPSETSRVALTQRSGAKIVAQHCTYGVLYHLPIPSWPWGWRLGVVWMDGTEGKVVSR